jgi:hypothetical protein
MLIYEIRIISVLATGRKPPTNAKGFDSRDYEGIE